ncbi:MULTISPECIES: YopX family protein [Bacillus]|uniref:YopX family protein n=1 Tax=Bacillus TaxID=1386 RepID=UPI0005AB98ED|nr:YopX family protein [Bacillus cereus]QKI12740.1 hypothetical protein FOC91_12330 [Bacillus cereus]
MREIKFRGWIGDGFIFSECVYQDNDVWRILSHNDDNWWACLDPQQYTGLKDKNGKEIYEGDILECHHKIKGNVFFHDGSYGISSEECELNVEDINTYDNLNVELINDNDLVVIGNIYENPELLEESK